MFGLSVPRNPLKHLAIAASIALGAFATSPEPVLANTVLKVTPTAEARVIELDMESLRRMPHETITTTTIWTEGEIAFTGVSLFTLVNEMGLNAAELSFVALNDYAVTIPLSDAVAGGPIIAYEMDGKPMSVRDKGPLWVIYPFDSKPVYQAEKYYSRSIWQLHRVEAVN